MDTNVILQMAQSELESRILRPIDWEDIPYEVKDVIISVAEQCYANGIYEGAEEGFIRGKEEGYEEGYDDGQIDAIESGNIL